MVSKIALNVIVPPASLLIIIAAGFLIITVCRRAGRIMIASGFLLLYLLSIGPVSHALLRPLETYAPPFKDRTVKADAIVVLGGGVTDLSWTGQPSVPSNASLARLIKGIELYRKLRIPLVLVGGNGDPSRKVIPDADAMKQEATALGVPSRDVIIENKSRDTIEGARALNQVIKGKRIILVTSAFHLKRSDAMFKKAGFETIPVPTDYLSEEKKNSFRSFIPHAGSLYASSAACREYLSLSWYRITRAI